MYEFQSPIRKKLKLKKFEKELEPQEVFLDSLAQKKEERFGLSEQKIEIPFSKNVPLAVYVVFLAIMVVFFCRVLQLQLVKGEELFYREQENRLRVYQIKPSRGIIYDSQFKQLVWNKPSADLILDKRDFPRTEKGMENILKEISKILQGFDVEEAKKKIEESETSVVLVYENLSHSDLVILEVKLKNEEEFPGIKIRESTRREYVKEPNFSHTIGYTGKINPDELKYLEGYSSIDYIGKTGLEKFYEEVLRGKPGKLQVEKDAYGRTIKESINEQSKAGENLILWLDSGLQKKIEEELKKKFKELGVEKAAAVALNPKNGGILALVSLPDFDNNKFSQGISQEELNKIQTDPLKPFVNRVISGEYLTGSTIKPLIASAALEERIISPTKKINCQGKIVVGPKDWEYNDWKIHGLTDIRKAIAESCNVYFYTVGGGHENTKGLGPEGIKKYLELFGWGNITGLDLPNEQKGFIPEPQWKKETIGEEWTIGNTYHLSIGQGYVSATPLQVAAAISAIANGGVLYQPQLVQKILNQDVNAIIVRQNFISPENLKIVREGMREAVIYGSAVSLQDLPVKAAAKTGTAQTVKEDYYHNWITVFAPFEDPRIVLTIVIEDVKGLQPAALPIAKEVLKWYFQH